MKIRHLLLLSAAAFISTSALATDRNYHSRICEVAESTSYSQSYYKGIGTIQNDDTTKYMRVLCPIVRTEDTTVSASVYVVDNSSTADARCYVWGVNAGGSSASGRVAYSSGASTAYQTLNLSAITPGGTLWEDAYIDCYIPARDGTSLPSKFLHYTITEN